MASEENLIDHLKGVADERQRRLLSLMRQDLEHVLNVMERRDLRNLVTIKEPLETRWEKLQAERDDIQMKVEKLLAAREDIRMKVEKLLAEAASLDPEIASDLSSEESVDPKQERRFSEKPDTLFAHRGSIKVTEEQDFSAIRKEVIDRHVGEENR